MGVAKLTFMLVIVQSILNVYGQQSKKFFRKDYTYIDTTESFYKIHSQPTTWPEAVKWCELEGATLFYPEDDEEAREVMAFRNRNKPQLSLIFIGLSDLLAEGAFATVDGRPITDVYNNWAAGEPNNYGGNEHCVVLFKEGELNDGNCDTLLPFICKKALKDLHWNEDCDMPRSDYVYNAYLDHCYKFHTDPKNWTEAFKVCNAENSYLAVINSQDEAHFLVELSVQSKKDNARGLTMPNKIFLGFHNKLGDGWKTIKGEDLEDSGYSNWSDGYPFNWKEKCGSMIFNPVDKTANGMLNDVRCDYRAFYICEHEIPAHSSDQIDARFTSVSWLPPIVYGQ